MTTREAVLDICADVFGIDAVPDRLGFFDLGGDSLLAMRVLGRVGDTLGRDVSLVTLYEAATLAEFADAVAAAPPSSPAAPAPPSSPAAAAGAGDDRASIGQESMFRATEAGQWTLRLTSVAFEVRGPLDESRLARALAAVTAAHESLRTSFHRDGTEIRRTVLSTVDIPLVVDDSSGTVDDAAWIRRWLVPFDGGRAPLFRVVWRRRPGRPHLLLFVFDHIIADVWSERLFCEQLSTAYADPDGPLPPEPVPFGAWAQWQRERLSGPHLGTLVRRWREQLGDDPGRFGTPLPGFAADAEATGPGTVAFTVDEDTTARVRRWSRAHGVTTVATLLGAYARAVGRLSGRTRLVFQTSLANRRLSAHERIIGPLFVTVPMVVDSTGGYRAAHAAVSKVTELGEIPYVMLRELLWPGGGAPPDGPVLYFAVNSELTALAFPGTEVTPVEFDWGLTPAGVETWLVEKAHTFDGTIRWPMGRLDPDLCGELAHGFLAELATIRENSR